MSIKIERQNKIKEILKNKFITNQEDLIQFLMEDNFSVKQATLSRDFAELGVIRIMTDQGVRYVLDPNESGKQIQRLISFEILNVDYNETLVVVRTLSGRAQGVAHYIDRLNKKEILGTVAGDDTIFIVPDSVKNISPIVSFVKTIMAIDRDNIR
ncbi:MAG: arginine repressor [Chitinispirillia bacterium]|jgi:transcriptional regulator of arginine metabolism